MERKVLANVRGFCFLNIMLLASVIALASFVAMVLIYMALTKYVENKKARDAATPAPAAPAPTAGDDLTDEPVHMVIEDSVRDEMLENARAMARDNPEHAAKLLRNWLHDEK